MNNAQKTVTVWKFWDFPATQILREINVKESRSSKTAILTILKLWVLILMNFTIYWGLKFTKTNIQNLKSKEMATFQILHWSELISRKIWEAKNLSSLCHRNDVENMEFCSHFLQKIPWNHIVFPHIFQIRVNLSFFNTMNFTVWKFKKFSVLPTL